MHYIPCPTGYFSFELQLPLPNFMLEVSLKLPGATDFKVTDAFFTVAAQALAAAGTAPSTTFQPPGLKLVPGWQVHYNITTGASMSSGMVLR